jgi:hypothetical protein
MPKNRWTWWAQGPAAPNWNRGAWWTAAASTWAPDWGTGTEIVVHQAADELACASMPSDEVSTFSTDSYIWWLLVLLCFAVVINMFCCLCFTAYFFKQKRALRVDISATPAADAPESVGVTPLLQLTPMEVQRGIAEAMREDEGQVYHFTPAGGKYHLAGCFITERNDRSFALTPCARCAVGNFLPIYEGAERQVYYADTNSVWPPTHYHVDRLCGRINRSMSLKDMCLHCVETQKLKMKVARLTLNRPFAEQELFAGRSPPREETMTRSEWVDFKAQLWR